LHKLILLAGSTVNTLMRVTGDVPGLIVADGMQTSTGKTLRGLAGEPRAQDLKARDLFNLDAHGRFLPSRRNV
jgi:hypothetical protein